MSYQHQASKHGDVTGEQVGNFTIPAAVSSNRMPSCGHGPPTVTTGPAYVRSGCGASASLVLSERSHRPYAEWAEGAAGRPSSGYGLRATRALVWLASAMCVTVATLMLRGLPNEEPKQEATGTVPAGGGKVTFEIDKTDPQNPTGN